MNILAILLNICINIVIINASIYNGPCLNVNIFNENDCSSVNFVETIYQDCSVCFSLNLSNNTYYFERKCDEAFTNYYNDSLCENIKIANLNWDTCFLIGNSFLNFTTVQCNYITSVGHNTTTISTITTLTTDSSNNDKKTTIKQTENKNQLPIWVILLIGFIITFLLILIIIYTIINTKDDYYPTDLIPFIEKKQKFNNNNGKKFLIIKN